jgi:hypothetical protein
MSDRFLQGRNQLHDKRLLHHITKSRQLLGYWIVAARTKGVASEEPFKSQYKTPAYPVFLYRFIRIGGTAWDIPTTGRKIRRNNPLIKPDHPQHQRPRHYHLPDENSLLFMNHDSFSI